MACKEGQFDVVELMVNDQFKTFSINLNAQHVNGMTPFDYICTVIRYSRVLASSYFPFTKVNEHFPITVFFPPPSLLKETCAV